MSQNDSEKTILLTLDAILLLLGHLAEIKDIVEAWRKDPDSIDLKELQEKIDNLGQLS